MVPVLNLLSRKLACQKLLSPKNLTVRRVSILEKIRGESSLLDKTNHKVIYEFKYVTFTAAFLKTKYLAPIVSVPLISTCFYLNQWETGSLLIIASVFQFILITGFSKLAENIVGKIYVNEECKTENVIISYIDSNGSRIDKIFCPDQLHLIETGYMKYLGFLNVKTAHENYKLNIANAHVHDPKALQRIFKDILRFMKVNRTKKAKKKSI